MTASFNSFEDRVAEEVTLEKSRLAAESAGTFGSFEDRVAEEVERERARLAAEDSGTSVSRKVVSSVDETFSTVVDCLLFGETKMSAAMVNEGQMHWEQLAQSKDGVRGNIDPFNQSTLHKQFPRDTINAQYVEVHTAKNGQVGLQKDGIILKLQNDWLGAAERDMHLRRRSRIRLEAHAASRAHGVGSTEGPVKNGLDRYLGVMMAVEA